MSGSNSPRITIVGAGLAGALLACRLGDLGLEVEVIERRPDPRLEGFTGGRSINLALSERGIRALERAGLAEQVLADAIPMRGRMLHSQAGRLSFQPYSARRSDAINSVSRGGLNIALLKAAEARSSVHLRFGARCVDVDPEAPSFTFIDEQTGDRHEVRSDLVIGADGAHSAVRQCMLRLDLVTSSQTTLEHGYKELTIGPTPSGDFALEPHALHIWPRGGYMMIALPNKDRSFTCTLFWPLQGANSFDALQTPAQIVDFFDSNFPDATPLMPDLVDLYTKNPVGSLMTVRCSPWSHAGAVALLGDAAHAIVPFYGQGMNCAFEDCDALTDCLGNSPNDLRAALTEYESLRRVNADAIADMALTNFIEMRDRVGSRLFRARKAMERALHRIAPRRFTPLYNMVSFTTIPYAEARRIAQRQASKIRTALIYGAIAGCVAAIAETISLLRGVL